MRYSLDISRKAYFRSIWLLAPYLALIVASIITLHNLYKFYSTPVDYLTDSLQLGILAFCYFSFAAYELSALIRHVEGEECLKSLKGASIRLSIAHVATLTTMLSVWTLFLIACQTVVCWLKAVLYLEYTIHYISSFILYFFLPGFIAILLGSCLRNCSRPIAYFFIICATVLCSSIPKDNFSAVSLEDLSLAVVLDWFHLTVPNSNWIADSVYGIAMEKCRWVLGLFWISLLFLLFSVSHRREIRKVRKIIFSMALTISLLMGINYIQSSDYCVLRKDYRPDGLIRREIDYRKEYIGNEVAPNFEVLEYDVQLKIEDELNAVVTMHVNNGEQLYRFTLFHDYQVLEVTDGKGNSIPFTRDGDYLDIQSRHPLSSITVKYKGSAWKYYANNQGVYLPAYAAYYPIPGHYYVWDEDNNAINTLHRSQKTIFRVTVDSHLTILSNLTQSGYNSFYGETEGVSLLGGLVTEQNENGLTIYQSFLDRSVTIDCKEIEETWEKLSSRMMAEGEFNVSNKKLFIQPLTVASVGASSESVVVYEDHILLSGNQMSEETICGTYLLSQIPNNPQKALVRELFSLYMFSSSQMEVEKKPSYSELEVLKKYGHHSEITDIDEWQIYVDTANITFYELFEYQLSAIGDETVLRSVYRYLLDDSDTTNQIDFIYYLGGEDNA